MMQLRPIGFRSAAISFLNPNSKAGSSSILVLYRVRPAAFVDCILCVVVEPFWDR
jgi:hypothetical protein